MIPQTKPSVQQKINPSWLQFKTEKEMEKVVTRWYGDPRASYYIINAAYKRRLAVPAALLYIKNSQRGLGMKHMMIANYACMVAGGSFNLSLNTAVSRDIPTINTYQGFAQGMADDAIKEYPNSPEILVLSSASRLDSIMGSFPPHTAELQTILKRLRRAQELDPKWADTYYWYSFALDRYGKYARYQNRDDSSDPAILARAKAPALTALRLDPGMKASCLRLLGVIAEDRKQFKEALNYVDAWVREEPLVKQGKIFSSWRDRIVFGLNQQSKG